MTVAVYILSIVHFLTTLVECPIVYIAVLPVNLVYSKCFTVDATFVVAFLLAILPVFDAVMRHFISAKVR